MGAKGGKSRGKSRSKQGILYFYPSLTPTFLPWPLLEPLLSWGVQNPTELHKHRKKDTQKRSESLAFGRISSRQTSLCPPTPSGKEMLCKSFRADGCSSPESHPVKDLDLRPTEVVKARSLQCGFWPRNSEIQI